MNQSIIITAFALTLIAFLSVLLLVQETRKEPLPEPVQKLQLEMVEELCPDDHQICEVSLSKLLEFPGSFNGKLVKTEGVLRIEFEGNSLYIDERAYFDRDHNRGVSASLGDRWESHSDNSGSTVTILGRFFGGKNSRENYGGYGHGGLYYGRIEIAQIWPES